MEEFGFDKLPEVVRQIFEKVEHIEKLLFKLQYEQAAKEKFLTVKEAAAYLQITVAALYSLVSRRQIPVNKPGKRLYFLNTDLDEWIKAGKLKTAEEIVKDAQQYLISRK
jgi:excisionase family DNA binding protein